MAMDTSYHHRFLAAQLEDPEFRAEYDRASIEIAIVDHIVQRLDDLRAQAHMSKAALAREVGMDPASIRRLFTSDANPTLRTVAALVAALGAEITIVPKATSQPERELATA